MAAMREEEEGRTHIWEGTTRCHVGHRLQALVPIYTSTSV
jgi:hypothetical protein